jgi:hypothetical protein
MQQQPPSGALSDFRDWMSQLLQGGRGRDDDHDHDDDHHLASANAAFFLVPDLFQLHEASLLILVGQERYGDGPLIAAGGGWSVPPIIAAAPLVGAAQASRVSVALHPSMQRAVVAVSLAAIGFPCLASEL